MNQVETTKHSDAEPVAWCVGYNDPRAGLIYSSPTMYKPSAEEIVANSVGKLYVFNLYLHPPQPCAKCREETIEELRAVSDDMFEEGKVMMTAMLQSNTSIDVGLIYQAMLSTALDAARKEGE